MPESSNSPPPRPAAPRAPNSRVLDSIPLTLDEFMNESTDTSNDSLSTAQAKPSQKGASEDNQISYHTPKIMEEMDSATKNAADNFDAGDVDSTLAAQRERLERLRSQREGNTQTAPASITLFKSRLNDQESATTDDTTSESQSVGGAGRVMWLKQSPTKNDTAVADKSSQDRLNSTHRLQDSAKDTRRDVGDTFGTPQAALNSPQLLNNEGPAEQNATSQRSFMADPSFLVNQSTILPNVSIDSDLLHDESTGESEGEVRLQQPSTQFLEAKAAQFLESSEEDTDELIKAVPKTGGDIIATQPVAAQPIVQPTTHFPPAHDYSDDFESEHTQESHKRHRGSSPPSSTSVTAPSKRNRTQSWSGESLSQEVEDIQKAFSKSVGAKAESPEAAEDLKSFLSSLVMGDSTQSQGQAEKPAVSDAEKSVDLSGKSVEITSKSVTFGQRLEASIHDEKPLSIDLGSSIDASFRLSMNKPSSQPAVVAQPDTPERPPLTLSDLGLPLPVPDTSVVEQEKPSILEHQELSTISADESSMDADRSRSDEESRKARASTSRSSRSRPSPSRIPRATTAPPQPTKGTTPQRKKQALERVNGKFSRGPTPDTVSSSSNTSESAHRKSGYERDKDTPLLKKKLAHMEEENTEMRHELLQLRLMTDEQSAEQVKLVEANRAKTVEIEKLREQVEYLTKKMRIAEADTSQDAADKANTSFGIDGVSLSEIVAGPLGEKVTKEQVEEVRRNVEEQEMLIKGYQTENERLVAQVKALQERYKESDKTWNSRSEKLMVENTQLRNQVMDLDNQQKVAIAKAVSEAVAQVREEMAARAAVEEGSLENVRRIHELEQEVEALNKALDKKDTEIADLKNKVKREMDQVRLLELEVQKKRKSKVEADQPPQQPTVSFPDKSEETETLHREVFAMKRDIDRLEKSLSEKESALDAAKSDVKDKNRAIDEQGKIIQDLRTMVDTLKRKNASLTNLKKSQSNLSEDTAKETRILKAVVQELETIIKQRHGTQGVNMIKSAKKLATSKIAQSLRSDAASTSRTADVDENQHERVPTSRKIEEMEKQKQEAENRVLELTRQVQTLEQDKVRYEREMSDMLSRLETLADQHRKEDLQKIEELEKTLDLVAGGGDMLKLKQRLERVTKERDVLEDEFRQRLREKEDTIADMERKLRQKRAEDLDDVRLELEHAKRENVALKSRIDVLEQTRRSVSESMAQLLKQAQEEAARIAMEHHGKALQMLREETKSVTEMLVDAQTQSLRKQLVMAEGDVLKWRAKAESMELVVSELKEEHAERDREYTRRTNELREECSQLRDDLMRARDQHTPERRQYDLLAERIRYLETKMRRQPLKRTVLSQENTQPNDNEDRQVNQFRKELSSLVNQISELKRNNY